MADEQKFQLKKIKSKNSKLEISKAIRILKNKNDY